MRKWGGFGWVLALALGTGGCGSGPGVSGRDLSVRFAVLDNGEYHGAFRSRCRLTLENRGDAVLAGSGWAVFFSSPPILLSEVPDSVKIRHINGDFHRLDPGGSFAPLAPGKSREFEFFTGFALFNESAAPAGFYLVWDPDGSEPGQPEPLEAFVEPFTRAEQSRRSHQDQLPVHDAESRFMKNAGLLTPPPEGIGPILPTPLSWRPNGGTLKLDATFQIRHEAGLAGEATHLAEALASMLGRAPEIVESTAQGGAIVLKLGSPRTGGDGPPSESYRLAVKPAGGVEIMGGSAAGVFYGIQSLLALAPPEAFRGDRQSIEIPAGVVEDAPRFGYRGMHLDVARNFQSAETVRKFLDVMASYKLNRFHFHLSDDEGWRLPVGPLPELTEVGGRRGHTLDESDRLIPALGSGPFPDPALSHGSGSYSRQEYVEILRHAAALHIEVIPEIDLPGHARAAIKAMQARASRLEGEGDAEAARRFALDDPDDTSQYRSVQNFTDNVVNVCQESTYRFVETVVDELVALHREADAPLLAVHVGGDEVPSGVWEKSPACQKLFESGEAPGVRTVEDLPGYFLDRVRAILGKRGLITAGWEEIALEDARQEGAPKPVQDAAASPKRAYVWNSVWGWGGEENAYRLANAGIPVVVCNASNLYLDMAYEKHPKEPGQAWAGFVDTRKAFEFAPLDLYKSAWQDSMGRPLDPASYDDATRLTAEGRNNVLGIQGQLWSEVATGRDVMEYLAFPKLLAVAERAWADAAPWEREEDTEIRARLLEADWSRFANALGRRELPRLDFRFGGVAYRLPPPGAVVRDGMLSANSAFPGLTVRFSTDGGEPTVQSQVYSRPVAVSSTVKLKTFDTRGRSSRASETAP